VSSPPATNPDVTVVVMNWNEVGTLAATVAELKGTLSQLGRPWEILIVDDGSSDGSEALADRLAGEDPSVRVIHHPVNLGLGGVYRTGFKEARGEFVTFFPADGQFPASIVAQFRPEMEKVDVVLGYLPERRTDPMGRLLSWGERLLYRALLGPMPRFQGVLMFRRSLLQRFPLYSAGRGWAVLMEFIIRASRAGVPSASLPTTIRPRSVGTSKVNNLRTIASTLRQIMGLRQHLRKRPAESS
jgi:glycosyltransferase involved in cell wall biosynthesis